MSWTEFLDALKFIVVVIILIVLVSAVVKNSISDVKQSLTPRPAQGPTFNFAPQFNRRTTTRKKGRGADDLYGGDGSDDDFHGGSCYDSDLEGYGGYPSTTTGGVIGGGHFRLKVSDPEYTALLNKDKVIEARLDRQPFNKLSVGDHVVVVRSRPAGDTSEYEGGRYKFDAEIVRVTKYKNLEALLKGEGLNKVYPAHKDNKAAVEKFSLYLPPGTSVNDPVIAFEFKHSTSTKLKSNEKHHKTDHHKTNHHGHEKHSTYAPIAYSSKSEDWRY